MTVSVCEKREKEAIQSTVDKNLEHFTEVLLHPWHIMPVIVHTENA